MNVRKLIINAGLILTLIIASSTWIGWITDNMILTSLFDKYIPMAPLTASCFLLLTIALWVNYYKKKDHWVVYVTSLGLSLLAINVFLTILNVPFFDIEDNLVDTRDMFGLVPMGRMSPITATLFLLSGIVLFLFTRIGNRAKTIAGIVNTFIFIITLTVFIGYLYDSPILYGETTIPIALTTTLGFALTTVTFLAVNGPHFFPLSLVTGDSTQAILLRTFLPFTAFLILASGAFQIYLRNKIFTNEALIISIVAIGAMVAVTLVTIYLARLISKKIDTIESEKKRLGSILEASSDWVIVYSTTGRLLNINDAVRKYAELPEEKMLSEITIDEIFPSWHITMANGLSQAKQHESWRGEVKLNNRMGKTLNLSVVLLFHHNSGGEGFISAIMRDIDELKQYQQRIELINDQLKQKNQDMEQFVYAISHDMREPVRMVSSFVGLIKMKLKNQQDEEVQQYLDFAISGAKRLDTMIKDLLEYSQYGKTSQEFTDCDLNKTVQEVMNSLQPLIQESHAAIKVADHLPIIHGYCSDIARLFQNLIANAIKYRGERNPIIEVFFSTADTHFTFGVRDNGIGIDKVHFKEIFRMFKRISPNDANKGSGIGLASCKKIVEVHGGKIWVESILNQGSTFYFTLPKQNAMQKITETLYEK